MLGRGVAVAVAIEAVSAAFVEVDSTVGVDGVGAFVDTVAGGLLVGSIETVTVIKLGVDKGVVVDAPGVSESSWRQPTRTTSMLSNSNAPRSGNNRLNELVAGIISPSFMY